MTRPTIISVAILLLLMATSLIDWTHQTRSSNCGYESCPTGLPNMINIHLVSHTHDDVGWLKTVDEYYYGDKSDIQRAGVQYILDSVVDELTKDPNKKFIYVETSFFWRWWNSRNDDVHEQVQRLVQSGQLEFISGGWCMNDEAGNHYVDTVDQMTWGMRFLNDTFGPCATPRVGWQIDPFGHSRETASLFAQMGFDGIFLGRIDYQDKEVREHAKTLEFVWNGSANLGVDGQLFTGVLPNTYSPPNGFCFDLLCNDEPIKDNPKLKSYNVDRKVTDFLVAVASQATRYATNHLIMTMGEDFNYQDAHVWFYNLDKLIHYVNALQAQGSTVNLFYSTPSCYLQALNKMNKTWTVKTDDFFPYASDPHAYWTGYFTSRPALKYYTKFTNNILQMAKQLSAIARLSSDNEMNLEPLKRAQGDVQHHDAVSGTQKQTVAYDYAESLNDGVDLATVAINDAYGHILPQGTILPPPQTLCKYFNVSYCQVTEANEQFVVIVYNPLGHFYQQHPVRIPILNGSYVVRRGDNGQVIDSQIVPLPPEVVANPEHQGQATNDLVFAAQLPPLGYNTYFVQKSSNLLRPRKSGRSKVTSPKIRLNRLGTSIQNDLIKATIDADTGLLQSVENLVDNVTINVTQQFLFYVGMAGNNSISELRASGAYILRPNGTDAHPVSEGPVQTLLVTGELVQEIHQNFSDYVSQVIRIYQNVPVVEFEWQVGPIPIEDGYGKEVISRFDTNLDTHELFYTDANGREVLERRLNHRPTWKLNISEPVAANYYPVNSRIFIKDVKTGSQLTVLTDRSQGGTSVRNGSLELMVHRRLLYDDGFGVEEALLEPGVNKKGLIVRGKHRLLVGPISKAAATHRIQALAVLSPPVVTIAPLTSTVDEWRTNFVTNFTGLRADLPPNVHLLTLEPWKNNTILLRLEHFLEKTDDPDGLSRPVTVNLKNMFSNFQVATAEETTLGANVYLRDLKRMMWDTDQDNKVTSPPKTSYRPCLNDDLDVTLQPMQIGTFILTVQNQ